jgi:hypothetical protein
MAPRRLAALPAPATEGLGPLDRDRAGTLADEGGVSAAAVESLPLEGERVDGRRRGNVAWRVAALLAAGALGVLVAWSVLRRRESSPSS